VENSFEPGVQFAVAQSNLLLIQTALKKIFLDRNMTHVSLSPDPLRPNPCDVIGRWRRFGVTFHFSYANCY